jgi:M6 family metalloprotease-like protein
MKKLLIFVLIGALSIYTPPIIAYDTPRDDIVLAHDSNGVSTEYQFTILEQHDLTPCMIPNLYDNTDFKTGTLDVGFPIPDWTINKSGVVNIGLIYLDFVDYRITNDGQSLSTGFITSPIEDYYRLMSNDKISFNWIISNDVINLSDQVSNYDLYGSNDGRRRVLDEASLYVRQIFDEIDAIFFIINPDVPLMLRNTVWASRIGDDIGMYHTILIGMDTNRHDISDIINHDVAHLFGLPDLYKHVCHGHTGCQDGTVDWLSQFEYAGSWSIMSYGTHHNNELLNWERWLLRWLEDDNVKCITENNSYNIDIYHRNDIENTTRMIVINLETHYNLVLEVKQQDRYCQTCKKGLLVYTVNSANSVDMTSFINIVRPKHSSSIILEDALLLHKTGYNSINYAGWDIEIIETYTQGFRLNIKKD